MSLFVSGWASSQTPKKVYYNKDFQDGQFYIMSYLHWEPAFGKKKDPQQIKYFVFPNNVSLLDFMEDIKQGDITWIHGELQYYKSKKGVRENSISIHKYKKAYLTLERPHDSQEVEFFE